MDRKIPIWGGNPVTEMSLKVKNNMRNRDRLNLAVPGCKGTQIWGSDRKK